MIKILLVLSTFAILFTSCEKIIAKDLTGVVPVLILPVANDTVSINPVHFKWQEMEGASKYHLMVVSPSFSSISQYVLDTMVTGTDFYFDLDSNEYELMLTGDNGAYTSDTLGPVKFWISTNNTTTIVNSVTLLEPQDLEYVNESFSGEFSWDMLVGATSHEFQIREGAVYATGTQIDNNPNAASSHTIPFALEEGEYHWSVVAYFGGIPTTLSTRALYVDTVNPNVATLSVPLIGEILPAGVVTFSWLNGVDPGTMNSPVYSTLEIATDLAFTNMEFSQDISGNTHDVTLTTGVYYWRVGNYDAAGNLASYSPTFDFSL